MGVRILTGDCREVLPTLPAESVHCVVTSPPYWGLRDYGIADQLGMEPTLPEFVAEIVGVFREVRRVLRADGTLWLNLGDSYASTPNGRSAADTKAIGKDDRTFRDKPFSTVGNGIKAKDLCGIPWRVAFALQADGWYLRNDNIWSKVNPMPQSVTDRCTMSHEYVFMLAKSERYHFDADAIREPAKTEDVRRPYGSPGANELDPRGHQGDGKPRHGEAVGITRNRRTVWQIPTAAFSEAHFATFPPALVEPCILAGCPKGGIVLDPFGGAGTTGLVADRLQRSAVLIEIKPDYVGMARRRLEGDAPLLMGVT